MPKLSQEDQCLVDELQLILAKKVAGGMSEYGGRSLAPTGRPVRRCALIARAEAQEPPPIPRKKLKPFLRNPGDLLALGPRVALGALQSLPQVLSQLPSDLNKLTELIKDPRPLQEKQAEAFDVVETRVADYVEIGTDFESKLKAGIASALPDSLKQSIPSPLREALLGEQPCAEGSSTASTSRPKTSPRNSHAPPSSFANGLLRHPPVGSQKEVAPGLASWTLDGDSEDEETIVPSIEPPTEPILEPAELEEARSALFELRAAVLACQTNHDPALEAMLRINVADADQSMRRRLEQLTALCERETEASEAHRQSMQIVLAEAKDLLQTAVPLLHQSAA